MTTTSPGRAGHETAHHLITALADAGLPARTAEDVLGGRYDQPTPVTSEFYLAFDRTAATYVADLRELEAG